MVARDGGEGDGCADKVPGATAQSTRNGPFHPDQNRKLSGSMNKGQASRC